MSAQAVRWVPLDRDWYTLYKINKSMFMFMQSSAVQVASAQGMEDSASAGMVCTHWWKVAWLTFVSAKKSKSGDKKRKGTSKSRKSPAKKLRSK